MVHPAHRRDDTASPIKPANAHALVAFIVTVADVTIANVGAPFSGLVFVFAVGGRSSGVTSLRP